MKYEVRGGVCLCIIQRYLAIIILPLQAGEIEFIIPSSCFVLLFYDSE